MRNLLGLATVLFVIITTACNKIDGTPLSSAHPFKWESTNGTSVKGLDDFGLSGASLEESVALIKNNADKFVELESSAWKKINSLEKLKIAIERADDLECWGKISAEQVSAEYDLVLGTVKGNNYYLIRVTNSQVTATSEDKVKITINGKFKE